MEWANTKVNHAVRIHVDESIKPVAQPHRRIPFHVRKQVEVKLRPHESEEITDSAEGPAPLGLTSCRCTKAAETKRNQDMCGYALPKPSFYQAKAHHSHH